MATEYNITQKQYNGVDYDTLYPQTTSQQVSLNDDAILYSDNPTVNGALIKQQEDITALNDKLNGDTLWKVLATGADYRKVGGIVFVRAYVNNASISTTYSTVGTLPSGYRPNTLIYSVAGNNGTSGFGVAYIDPSGAVGIKTNSGTATSYWFQFSFPV